ncbi:MAG TPA: hypothetical protein VMO20_06350, partial [Candidatus Acidoferrum sp.]|nr:hypothetical protein [Candidatus Acidoferrum sp.]
VVTHATLQVTEQGTPNNNIFNRGAGSFQIRWIANTNWTEGTGTPMNLTTDGICYTNEPGLLNSNTDMNLGTFTNSGMTMTLFFALSLPAGFVNTVTAGGEVDFYLTALTPGIGFTFNSHQFGTQSQWPLLEISAEPQPGLVGISLSGTNVVLSCTNGAVGETCLVLASTNLVLPLNQWPPVATNQLGATGNFSVTVTNAAGPAALPETYFILQAQ